MATEILPTNEKTFLMKVRDPNTLAIKEIYDDSFFIDKPKFTEVMNSGASAITIRTTIDGANLYQASGRYYASGAPNPAEGDLIELWIQDKEARNGRQIYSGIHGGAELTIENDSVTVDFFVLPKTIKLAKRFFRDGVNTTISYTNTEAADIVKDIIDNIDSGITYDTNSVQDTGELLSLEFRVDSGLDAINRVVGALPFGYYFYIGADDKLYLRNNRSGDIEATLWDTAVWDSDFWDFDPSTVRARKHDVLLGVQASKAKLRSEIIDVANRVIFIGGDTGGGTRYFKTKEDATSQSRFGVYEELLADERVTTDGTAEKYIDKLLSEKKDTASTVTVDIIDSNFSNQGYDIEEIQVGDRLVIRTDLGDPSGSLWDEAIWDSAFWDYPPNTLTGRELIIKKKNYNWDFVTLECDLIPELTSNGLQANQKQILEEKKTNIPSSPTSL